MKFIGTVDTGCGPFSFVIEAATEEKANSILYDRWLEACESECDRRLRPWSQEMQDDLDAEEL